MITGLRKFLLILIFFLMTWIALMYGKISDGVFQTVTIALAVAFTSGNVLSNVGGKIAENLSVDVKSQEVNK